MTGGALRAWWLNPGEDGWLRAWLSLPFPCKFGFHDIKVKTTWEGEPGKNWPERWYECCDCRGFFGYEDDVAEREKRK